MSVTNRRLLGGRQFNLYEQEIYGENRIVDASWASGKASFLDTRGLCPGEQSARSSKILAIYTTKNTAKIACLKGLLESTADLTGRSSDITHTYVKTDASEGVYGAQPYTAEHGRMANRARCQEAYDKVKADEGDYFLLSFRAIFILSIESDISHNYEGWFTVPAHDEANMLIVECFSGHFVEGLSRGPGVQQDLLFVTKKWGFIDQDGKRLAGKLTYGDTLVNILGTVFPTMTSGNWQVVVCNLNRDDFLIELRDVMLVEIRINFHAGRIDFNLRRYIAGTG